MPTGMGVTDSKFVKGGRKLKKTKHCTIPKTLMKNEKWKSFKNKDESLQSECGQEKYQHRKYAEECTKPNERIDG